MLIFGLRVNLIPAVFRFAAILPVMIRNPSLFLLHPQKSTTFPTAMTQAYCDTFVSVLSHRGSTVNVVT